VISESPDGGHGQDGDAIAPPAETIGHPGDGGAALPRRNDAKPGGRQRWPR